MGVAEDGLVARSAVGQARRQAGRARVAADCAGGWVEQWVLGSQAGTRVDERGHGEIERPRRAAVVRPIAGERRAGAEVAGTILEDDAGQAGLPCRTGRC